MPQCAKGQRRLVGARVPDELAAAISEAAKAKDLTVSEFLGDLAADALGLPRPSDYLPRPRRKHLSPAQQGFELMKEGPTLGLTA